MTKTRGFKLSKMVKWSFRARRELKSLSLPDPPAGKSKPVFKIFKMLTSLKRRAERLCFSRKSYIRVADDATGLEKPVKTPKGHLIVYVGESGTETSAYLVPVIYFNHPMFIQLLESSEKVNGPGRIRIPCEASQFEKVKRSIAASESFRQHRWGHRHRQLDKLISWNLGRLHCCMGLQKLGFA